MIELLGPFPPSLYSNKPAKPNNPSNPSKPSDADIKAHISAFSRVGVNRPDNPDDEVRSRNLGLGELNRNVNQESKYTTGE